MGDLGIRCKCGSLRGVAAGLSPDEGFRVVCYCDDCQAFAERLGAAADTLDAHGGTDIFQTSPAHLRITDGIERLACLRLTPKGPLRWYASCCNTPIGNTLQTAQIPFVGLIHSCLDANVARLDDVLGPVCLRVMAKFARGKVATLDAHDSFAVSHVLEVVWKMLRWRLRGDHKRSPFFDPVSGDPVVAPR